LFGVVRGGTMKNLNIENANITGGIQDAGGVAGTVFDNGSVENCSVTGAVSGKDYVGGVAGRIGIDNYILENCYAAGAVYGNDCVGGVAGYIYDSSNLNNCVALNPGISGSSNAGRVVGYKTKDYREGINSNVVFNSVIVVGGGMYGMAGGIISAEFVMADGTLGGLFTAEDGWTVQPGKLPGLGAPVDMPAHIR